MKITLSKHAGFCEGVQRAYETVEKLADDPKVKKPIFVLGSLVHNDEVVAKIESLGIKKINVEGRLEDFFEKIKKEVGTLIITAHGTGPKIYELAKKNQIDLVDATCPRVIKVQRLAKNFFEKNVQIVIIGEKNHKEVVGIFQWGGERAIFVETEEDLNGLNLDTEKEIAVLAQTTQDQEFVRRVNSDILKKYPNAQIIDSICLATQNRQDEVKRLATENEIVVVIGSTESSNSKRLWELSVRLNKNSYFIQGPDHLRAHWFAGKKTVAVTAGASTPGWIVQSVISELKNF
ncbi:MAG: 4-hydroxy-3-methylbut-2-enyl diphosphate reductase [Candidatus Moranbacteria bacterium]|nr:4-hydroxy-3-methylbut-2-enyl diphosphate reductase [Candidatus Moranbacteria bacterium]